MKAENEALKERDNAQDSIIAQLRQELDALKDSLNKYGRIYNTILKWGCDKIYPQT
ncbi:hypothetical protein [Veillonella sp.]|uniref:hypothetical protein n=1 Tax=Veillonella sp. TaxID=1926307 RepID=UPI0025FA2F21|nr:hypothetical protein [Veillonella sp.]